ncbi:MAG: hypothetical protein ABIK83_14115 [Candidatus Zixiibacteriota bacterium]
MKEPFEPGTGQARSVTDDDRRRRHALMELARELEWLEQNTTSISGEAAAVRESWGNVDRALGELGLPEPLARDRPQEHKNIDSEGGER